MISEHRIRFADANTMSDVASQNVHLVVTSPPYPMIEMWDELFCQHTAIKKALHSQRGMTAFELMHRQLDRVWNEIHRVLVPGGIACINIGDATRTLEDEFALYPNHSRILAHMLKLGFSNLPNILWRKQTNAPNKFMGSGMMPPGAYVTLEHEYILIFRKGDKRLFKSQAEKANRRQSAFFWEERNQWFSDVWMDLKGTRQKTGDKQLRKRSGAYPFELAYRLICMFSVMGDTVLDPFLGTGTTLFAAAAAGRNSLGFELEKAFQPLIDQGCQPAIEQGRRRIGERFDGHLQFVRNRQAASKTIKHTNQVYGFPVITRQEVELMIPLPVAIQETVKNQYQVTYEMPEALAIGQPAIVPKAIPTPKTGQLTLFD
ncbi:site-specific DNA-methyltransferase [Desulfosarcina sp.]|uniref:DNA-methyltransferase n=1 Tax=Desulfosarcina sp. TaxID=2027861 RepID=UPI0029BE2074|nr:site-specific DNA-methyltransferase [Desulfosarcina sp.]MDX2452865.1 site-specific DNA-methyltransferase [Desulfosarcina sp.]MDX2490609.1 site-specific DNA-methyltransferase [Desulfosarcina sp.]